MSMHDTENGKVFRWTQLRNEAGVPAWRNSYVLATYEIPLTPDEVAHVEACEEYGAARDAVLAGLDMSKIREV